MTKHETKPTPPTKNTDFKMLLVDRKLAAVFNVNQCLKGIKVWCNYSKHIIPPRSSFPVVVMSLFSAALGQKVKHQMRSCTTGCLFVPAGNWFSEASAHCTLIKSNLMFIYLAKRILQSVWH